MEYSCHCNYIRVVELWSASTYSATAYFEMTLIFFLGVELFFIPRLHMCTTRDVLSSTFWRNSLIHAISHKVVSRFTLCVIVISYNNYNKNFYKNQLKFLSGTEGVRTLDPLRARQVLSQLSYSPERVPIPAFYAEHSLVGYKA